MFVHPARRPESVAPVDAGAARPGGHRADESPGAGTARRHPALRPGREGRSGGFPAGAAAERRSRDRLIPTRPADRRLSKVETLRLAASYISHLANVLLLQQRRHDEGVDAEQPCPQNPQPRESPQPCSPPGSSTPRPICTFCLSEQRQRHREGEKPPAGPAVSGH
ncbi:basic helix-loop-helix transcription factor scleraxis-like [Pipra filicauda]|uniref:Basic helix-loop-helix transcription factor scleraxis-like n=1 Tax=Pipra filicauda TaxID=649802 RepID=A0A7R5KWV3_9PASS|nr:basic helix-loop-helix transcription factor scleraxis-like [Pipra filicauda]